MKAHACMFQSTYLHTSKDTRPHLHVFSDFPIPLGRSSTSKWFFKTPYKVKIFFNSNCCSSSFKCKGRILLYAEMSQLSPHIPIVVCFGHNRLLTTSPVHSFSLLASYNLFYDFLFNHFCFMVSTNCQQATRGKQTHCPCSRCLLLVSGIFSQTILWSGVIVWEFVLVLYGWVYFVRIHSSVVYKIHYFVLWTFLDTYFCGKFPMFMMLVYHYIIFKILFIQLRSHGAQMHLASPKNQA